MLMRTSILAILLSFLIIPIEARASIQLNESPPGSAAVAYTGDALFINTRTGFSATLDDTIITKTFGTGVTSIVFDNVTYEAGDTDFSGGFRWTERVTNNTGFAWSAFTLSLSETTGAFFADAVFSPSFVTINGGAAISGAANTILNDDTIAAADTIGTAVRSADKKQLTFTFNTPLASGLFFDIHAPIEGLPTAGNFELAQAPTLVPEAASLIVWSLLGATIAGALWIRRRKLSA